MTLMKRDMHRFANSFEAQQGTTPDCRQRERTLSAVASLGTWQEKT